MGRGSAEPEVQGLREPVGSLLGPLALFVFVYEGPMQKINQMTSEIPIMIALSFTVFAFYPTWETALVSIGTFAFVAFKLWLTETRTSELQKLRDEIKIVKNQVEGIQVGRALGR